MNIYIITNRISNPITGGEFYNHALLEGARKAGLTVYILEQSALPKLFQNILGANLYYLYKTLTLPRNSAIIFDTSLHMRFIIAFIFQYLFKKRTPAIGMLHHFDYWDKPNKLRRAIHKTLEKFICSNIDYLITNTQFTYNNYLSLTNKQETFYKILNPYLRNKNSTPTKAQQENRITELLQVGTIERRKNILNTVTAIIQSELKIHCTFAGNYNEDPYFNSVQELIKKHKAENLFTFTGRVSDEDLERLYLNADIFILVSQMEGYGMVYAEAMKYGLPIIGTTAGAVPDLVINNVNGALCDPNDVTNICKTIIEVTHSKEKCAHFSKNNIESYKKMHDRDTFTEASKLIFEEIQQKVQRN